MSFSERLQKALHEENAIQRYVCRKLFDALQPLGIHVTGDHFYEIIPDTRRVAQLYRDEPRAISGIEFNVEAAEETALCLVEAFGSEFASAAAARDYVEQNHYFRGMDAVLLYCYLRHLAPAKVVEVGQGFSTRVILAALERNFAASGKCSSFVSIDPYSRYDEPVALEGVEFTVQRRQLEDIDSGAVFPDAEFVFIDSSHVYKFGSDVEFELEQLYPNLPSGVTVHVHDIFSPYHYPRDWIVRHKRFWNEQYYLENFLKFNACFRIVLPVYYLSRRSPALVALCARATSCPDGLEGGSSLYLEKIL